MTLGLGFLAGLASGLAGCATIDVGEPRVVSGRVTDEAGQAVSGTPVLLVVRDLEFVPTQHAYREIARQDLTTVTDTQGRYRFEFVPRKLGNDFHLFFHAERGFDSARFQRAEPVGLNSRLAREGAVTVNHILKLRPDWAAAERLIAEVGAGSPRGRILRQYGYPEKIERLKAMNVETEVWWYYARGISFKFSDGEFRGQSNFEPIRGAGPKPPAP
jgi:hypothetical protein